MKFGSTLFLKGVVALIGLVVLAILVFALPAGIMSDNTGDYRPILAGLYLPAIPFYLALYQTLKLLSYVEHDNAFSEKSVTALKKIKNYGFIIGTIFTVGLPYIFMVADKDDAPGVILVGMVIAGAAYSIGVFSAVLQKLLRNAIDIKTENDLTV
jgi:O-antigen/teichoic acid export membrane protein